MVLALDGSASLDATVAADQVRELARASVRRRRPGHRLTGVAVGAGWSIRGETQPDTQVSVLVAVHSDGTRVELARTGQGEVEGDRD